MAFNLKRELRLDQVKRVGRAPREEGAHPGGVGGQRVRSGPRSWPPLEGFGWNSKDIYDGWWEEGHGTEVS